jgi:hypothetical protein
LIGALNGSEMVGINGHSAFDGERQCVSSGYNQVEEEVCFDGQFEESSSPILVESINFFGPARSTYTFRKCRNILNLDPRVFRDVENHGSLPVAQFCLPDNGTLGRSARLSLFRILSS